MNTGMPLRASQLLLDLEAAAAQRRLSKAAIARGAGISINTLLGFRNRPGPARPVRERWNPTLRTIQALESFLLAEQCTPEGICKAQLDVFQGENVNHGA